MLKVLITGASDRIGREIAVHFYQKGWQVVVHYNSSTDAALELQSLIGCKLMQTDFTDEAALLDSINSLEHDYDLLINNASIFKKTSDQNLYTEFNKTFATNLYAPIKLTKWFEKNCRGNVINILDAGMHLYAEKFLAYYLSKKALEEFIIAPHLTIAENVRLNGVALGATMFKNGQAKEVFNDVAEFHTSSVHNICKALDYIISNNSINRTIIDLTKWK